MIFFLVTILVPVAVVILAVRALRSERPEREFPRGAPLATLGLLAIAGAIIGYLAAAPIDAMAIIGGLGALSTICGVILYATGSQERHPPTAFPPPTGPRTAPR